MTRFAAAVLMRALATASACLAPACVGLTKLRPRQIVGYGGWIHTVRRSKESSDEIRLAAPVQMLCHRRDTQLSTALPQERTLKSTVLQSRPVEQRTRYY